MNRWQEFGQWWAESEPELLRAARRYGGDPDDSRDVVQDLAVLAIQNYERFSEKEQFRRWAFARLHWLILDRFRVARRTVEGSVEDVVAPVDSQQEDETLVRQVTELIETLPARQRQVLMMTAEGSSPAAIGEKMGITQATVRSLRRFGRSQLAVLLSKKDLEK